MIVVAPPELALVNPIAQDGLKLKRIHGGGVHRAVCNVPKTRKSCTFTAIDYLTVSDVVSAHYLAGFRVKCQGGPLPKGRLRAEVDGDFVVEEDLSFFAQDVEPVKVPWKKKPLCLFYAIPLENGVARPKEIVGFALPNASRIKVYIDLEIVEEAAEIEIEVLGGLYLGGYQSFPVVASEVRVPEMEYPRILALVTPQGRGYFKMEFREELVWKERFSLGIPSCASSRTFRKVVETRVTYAQYLAGVRVILVDGVLPNGILRVSADGEKLLEEDIAFFAKEPQPSSYPWKRDTQANFLAIPFDSTLQGDRVGFFLPNNTKVEVYLDFYPVSEKATLGIEVLGALYNTMGGPLMPTPLKEKTAS